MGQAVFYEAGTIGFPGNLKLQLQNQGMPMVQLEEGKIKNRWISDPSHKLNKIILTMFGIYPFSCAGYSTTIKDGQPTFIIDLPKGMDSGKSISIKF